MTNKLIGVISSEGELEGVLENTTLEVNVTITETGPKGSQGEQGIPGNDGYTPIKGVDYFDGEKGEQGEQGIPGNDGYTPVKGVDYFDGEQGPKGDPGEMGIKGEDGYTPIKGVDYFDGEQGPRGDPGIVDYTGLATESYVDDALEYKIRFYDEGDTIPELPEDTIAFIREV